MLLMLFNSTANLEAFNRVNFVKMDHFGYNECQFV
ncbi:Uncharacterised protein [Klebsiella quasipneumoniae]|nr:Uncharacterised protein [Klebsiella quasipneumoniae]